MRVNVAAGPVEAGHELVRDDRHGAGRGEDERDREERERRQLGPQLARGGRVAGGVQQRRQEDEEHDVGLERDVRERRDEPDHQPADDQDDRVRDRGQVGHPHEGGGGEQQDD